MTSIVPRASLELYQVKASPESEYQPLLQDLLLREPRCSLTVGLVLGTIANDSNPKRAGA